MKDAKNPAKKGKGVAKKTKAKKKDDAAFNERERNKRMTAQLGHIQKVMGKDAVRAITEEYAPTPCHSTGIPSLDRALNGGIPKGRITEAFGPEGGGKTTLSLSAAVQAQKAGGIVYFIDAENKFDQSILEILGIDRKAFILSVPDTAEKVWGELSLFLDRAGPEDMAIVDSIAMMRPQDEIHGKIEDGASVYGNRAKLNALGINQIKGKITGSGGTVIIINQVRFKMGVSFGNPETTPGGDELKYAAGTRLRIVAGKFIDEGSDANKQRVGHICNIHSTKCNHSKPYQYVKVPLIYGVGFEVDGTHELFEDALACGVITRKTEKGSTYLYGEHSISGRKNFLVEIKKSDTLRKWLSDAVERQTGKKR